MKNEKFKKYKRLKSFLSGKLYRGYPLDLVLGSYIGMMTWNPSIALYVSYVFYNIKGFKFPDSSEAIYTYSTQRDDYLSLIDAYFTGVKPDYVRVHNTKKDYIIGMFYSLIAIIRSVIFTRKIKCTLLERLKLIVVVSIAFKVIDELEEKEIRCKKYIAFNSSYLIESFLSYYFRIREVNTYSLQHGMYHRYINEIPYNVICYENVCAAELLVWGEFSNNEVRELLPTSSSTIVFGYPDSKFPVTASQLVSNRILVLLPRDLFIEKTLQLLDYLSKYNFEYVIRPHPSVSLALDDVIKSKDNFTLDANKVLSDTLTEFKFDAVISFNSTAIFEASLCNQNVLLFNTDEAEFTNPGFNEFTLQSELNAIIDNNVVVKHQHFFSKVNLLKLS